MIMRAALLIFFLQISFVDQISSQSIKFAVVSDIHYMSEKLIDGEGSLSRYQLQTGRDIVVMHEVLDSVLANVLRERPDILLVTGDMTNHGEKQSHIDIIKKLDVIRSNGIRVFVIPGNHDINIPNAQKYINGNSIFTESISESEFEQLYYNFGFQNAFERDNASLGYVVEINEDTWLIALDTNLHREYTTSSKSSGRISTETMEWVLDVLHRAELKGVTVLGMMHHGLVEHMPYQAAFFPEYLIDDWQQNAQKLADAGLKIVFTGHFHSNDITMYSSSSGNRLYDIETGSLIQYPFPYRIIELKNNRLNVRSFNIKSTPSAPNLYSEYRDIHQVHLRKAITSKLNNLMIPISSEVNDALVELLVRMGLQHAAGDEILDAEMYTLVKKLGDFLEDFQFDTTEFGMDFPPLDNNIDLIIK